MAIPSGSRTHASAHAYDVKVLAFPAASPRTVQGLMQLFRVDQAAAERLIASVPLLLAQQASAADAEACAQALRMLGARVLVEPSAQPSAPSTHWSQPSTLEEDLLPQPRVVPVANDTELEYDVLSAQEPGYQAHTSISTNLRGPIDMELAEREPDRMADDKPALRRQRQDSLDLQADYSDTSQGPDLELAAPAPGRKPNHPAERAHPEKREPTGPQPVARPRAAEGPAPHARAAVVQRSDQSEQSSRTLPLLQLCFALGVFALGYWAQSSVIFGSASLWSVVAHGVALYQLVLGVRGLAS